MVAECEKTTSQDHIIDTSDLHNMRESYESELSQVGTDMPYLESQLSHATMNAANAHDQVTTERLQLEKQVKALRNKVSRLTNVKLTHEGKL